MKIGNPESYAGKKKCGCVVACVANYEGYENDMAKTLGEFIKEGLTIVPMTLKESGTLLKLNCPHNPQTEAS